MAHAIKINDLPSSYHTRLPVGRSVLIWQLCTGNCIIVMLCNLTIVSDWNWLGKVSNKYGFFKAGGRAIKSIVVVLDSIFEEEKFKCSKWHKTLQRKNIFFYITKYFLNLQILECVYCTSQHLILTECTTTSCMLKINFLGCKIY